VDFVKRLQDRPDTVGSRQVPTVGPKDVVIGCSNDYLGMGRDPKVIGATVETATRVGTGV
jgi:7-keto-8-aminopelargonate synthetase-like enzyme